MARIASRSGSPPAERRKYPILIYQHVPKCGGRSFLKACGSYFNIVADQPPPYPSKEQIADFQKTRLDLAAAPDRTLVHGHLVFNGIRPLERYPEEIASGRCGLFTIVRDPLERAISAYFHRRRKGRPWGGSLEDWLSKRRNNICNFLGIQMRGGQLEKDPFCMIGITERLQDSLDLFASLTGMPIANIERINVSPRDEYELPQEVLDSFRKENHMDYALRDYAERKLEQMLAEREPGSAPNS